MKKETIVRVNLTNGGHNDVKTNSGADAMTKTIQNMGITYDDIDSTTKVERKIKGGNK